jgi:phosphate transport system permease protein
MTDATASADAAAARKATRFSKRGERTRRRHAAERRFRMMGLAAVIFGIVALVGLLGSILSNGASSFRQTYITLDVYLDPAKLDKAGNRNPEALQKVTTFGYAPLLNAALESLIEERGIVIEGLGNKDVSGLISKEAPAQIRRSVLADPSQIGETVTFSLLADRAYRRLLQGPRHHGNGELDRNVSPSSCCSPTN